ncbi:MAG: DNA polymerase IV [Kiritimatiellae bacterium]|nr:DNA polymerase IV [Kiritimatiellia bacterium]
MTTKSNKTILHVDMDAFFASVEQHDHPELQGKPVVVGAQPDKRGVVSAASYEAREYGIHSAMPSREAYQRCPDAIFMPVNSARYGEVSREIHKIFEEFTPFVESVSIDEAFLDVTGSFRIFGDGATIARKIKDTIKSKTGLNASVGVAHNKFLAKLASDLDKPDGLTVVPSTRGQIMEFLAPLAVSRIWGVGKVTGATLAEAGITTIGQLQKSSEAELGNIIGKHSARHLLRLAMGEDERELEMGREEKSISKEHTFEFDCQSPEELKFILAELVDNVGDRLRQAGKFAGQARLKLRWQGFKTITRQRIFPNPVCDDFSLREMANAIFDNEELIKPVRLIGFGVGKLADSAPRQLSLFGFEDVVDAKKERLSRTVDDIREKLGQDSIRRGSAGKQK